MILVCGFSFSHYVVAVARQLFDFNDKFCFLLNINSLEINAFLNSVLFARTREYYTRVSA